MADAHVNIILNEDWEPLVTVGDDFTLTLPRRGGPVEVVPMATATPPADNLIGHVLSPTGREAFNRSLSGPGYIYGRSLQEEAVIALSTWTP